MPPQLAHDISSIGLKALTFLSQQKNLISWNCAIFKNKNNKNIIFSNPLGIAGGVDKDGLNILDWQNLNCGFIEIGTVTLIPQAANSGKIIDRDLKTKSLWNKMGFPSKGSDLVYENVLKVKKLNKLNVPLFINIGKNRTTSNENAFTDYNNLMTKFENLADAFVVNISSPNTQGLGNLTQPEYLNLFLKSICDHHSKLTNQPLLFIKLGPDMLETDFEQSLHTALDYNIDGFVLTNTTRTRTITPFYPDLEGGVSGWPLQKLSLSALRLAKKTCETRKMKKIIISVGGVMTADDVFERIEAGADLIQVYTTLVFEGPLFFRKVAAIALQNFKHDN